MTSGATVLILPHLLVLVSSQLYSYTLSPKSANLTTPSLSTNILANLISLCIIERECKQFRPNTSYYIILYRSIGPVGLFRQDYRSPCIQYCNRRQLLSLSSRLSSSFTICQCSNCLWILISCSTRLLSFFSFQYTFIALIIIYYLHSIYLFSFSSPSIQNSQLLCLKALLLLGPMYSISLLVMYCQRCCLILIRFCLSFLSLCLNNICILHFKFKFIKKYK